MSRAPDRTPMGTWEEDTWDRPAEAPEPPVVETDDDRDYVGVILDRRGRPMREVRSPGRVDLGFQRRKRDR